VLISACAKVPRTMRKLHALFAFAGVLTLNIFASGDLRAQARRGVTPEDYFSFKFIADPHIRPTAELSFMCSP
jgi:hypothetical protein